MLWLKRSWKLFTWNGAASGEYTGVIRCQSDWFDASQMTDRVVSGDFNDDGYDDIVGFFSYGNQTSNLFYFRGVANGSTMPHGVGYTGSDIHAVNMTNAVVAGDFDGDGDEEIYTLYTDASGAVLWEFYVGTNPTFVRVEKWRQY